MAITTITKNFGKAIKSVLPIVCGVPESVLNNVSDRYSVEITAALGDYDVKGALVGFGNKPGITIYAYLQEKIVLNSATTWSGIIQGVPGLAELQETADFFSQGIFGRTAKSTLSTQRKWSGSEPISLSLKLKFEAVNNVEDEVLKPCRFLQSLTLPTGGFANVIGLIPPGPNPFTIKQNEDLRRGENITINIGNFISFSSVIIKSVRVTYENRMSDKGPIGAEVDLGIETWRMLTREELADAYTTGLSMSRPSSGVQGTTGNIPGTPEE